MNGKPFYKSKTFWFNVICGVAALLFSDIKPYVSPELAGILAAAGNLLLRYVTTGPIALK